jgi:transposase InsO family protein
VSHWIRVRRVLADNGPGYLSPAFAILCRTAQVQHRRTRAYTPRTDGKAERFIQTLLREWAYVRAYRTSAQRQAALPHWIHHYNVGRPPMPVFTGVRPPAAWPGRTIS